MDLYISREYGPRYWENNEEKSLYYVRNEIDILSPSLYTFYELLFPHFTEINSDGKVKITKFFKHHKVMRNLDLSECYDSEYTETDVRALAPMIICIYIYTDTPNDFITAFSDFLRQVDGAQNIISAFLSRELTQPSTEWCSTNLTSLEQ
ncbi:hypothetical protein RclHR1_02920012 [Rhizophagus clarus]|uniref:Uncharacterized protein n=1 Tax=Rhizophagus clarus TaxID=94130 RepID=A0A2Z6R469_9GLOM|nr:hypothetical protein RclHR1_02920012 [Rhizophagus clarus]